MSQLLSLARNYFEQGKASLDARRKDEAAAAFGQAKEKINQVKVVFPLNQEAGVLALRIDQIQDPAAFRQEFAAKYGEAKAGMKTPTNEVYAQLVDLSKIDPSYPGLKDSIYQAEIALGLRMAPPDPAKQRRANDLTAAARAIVDSGDTGRFSIALNQINEAIQLDPNNDKALAIKDRILTFQGGTAQIVLSSYAEEHYRQAVQEFQGGNLLQANAIVQRLLQDPKNAKSQKIIDLSKKIQARL
jgi:tetratricopeptide (TPR) repeat protein